MAKKGQNSGKKEIDKKKPEKEKPVGRAGMGASTVVINEGAGV